MIKPSAFLVLALSFAACDVSTGDDPPVRPEPAACECAAPEPQELVLPVYVVPVTSVIYGRAGVPAMCDAGDVALSGGCMGKREDGPAVLFQGAATLDEVGAPSGWFCEAEPAGPGEWTVHASVTCLTIGQP